MRTADLPRCQVRMADSPMDVARWLKATPRVWRQSSSIQPRGASWDGGADWTETLRMAEHGWDKGRDAVYDALSALPPPATSHHKRMNDMGGDYPDVARYLQGEPANMVRRGKTQGAKPTVHIIVNMTTSASVRADHYKNFGLAMCAVIDKLEASGRRVELDVMFANSAKQDRLLVGWNVKHASDALDFSSIAFSLAHPAAYRRFGFGMWERSKAGNEDSGYGHCSDLTKVDAALLDCPDAFIVNCTGQTLQTCDTPVKAINFARLAINRAAGETIVENDND